ncbi:DUF5713 family protein [Aquimarina sp. M1]
MPFPIDEKYISNTESELCVEFPKEFKERMIETNGGELVLNNYQFDLHSFFDKTDNHSATDRINDIEDEFFENNSEIEIGAIECLGSNFEFISKTYGFDATIEELIATRNW